MVQDLTRQAAKARSEAERWTTRATQIEDEAVSQTAALTEQLEDLCASAMGGKVCTVLDLCQGGKGGDLPRCYSSFFLFWFGGLGRANHHGGYCRTSLVVVLR